MTEPDEAQGEDREGEAVRALLKRSLGTPRHVPDLLPGIQRRIRRRSRGKFFADGWSTAQTRASYVLIGLLTLLVVAMAYYALGPMIAR